MIPNLLQNLIRLQNSLDPSGRTHRTAPFGAADKAKIAEKTARSATFTKNAATAGKSGIDAGAADSADAVKVGSRALLHADNQPRHRMSDGQAPATVGNHDTIPYVVPEIVFLNTEQSDADGRKKSERHPKPELPTIAVRWKDTLLTFRAVDAAFSRMKLEWNGPVPDEGAVFRELLIRLKGYGIEEIYRNGRLVSTERQA